MTLRKIVLLFMAFCPIIVLSQNFIISGCISDSMTGESLAGATIYIKETGNGVITNSYGYYSIQSRFGINEIQLSFVGYKSEAISINVKKDTIVNFNLHPGLEISEVEVSAWLSQTKINSTLSGIEYLNSKKIESFPAIAGESDPFKAIQYLPGVKSGNEGTSNINVRGGSHDQNLILLDGVPVYNTSHLFGYLSTFNNDAIKDINFYKGSIPARFGGRLSSVVDVSMKEGNKKKSAGSFSISPVAGRLMLEGPIKKDTASYMISVRRAWLDLPLRIGQAISSYKETLGYAFYDINLKANWKINSSNRVYMSHYQGKDGYVELWEETQPHTSYNFNWGNYTSVIRWNKIITPKVFVNTSVYHSLFQFQEKLKIKNEYNISQKVNSGLEEFSLKCDFDYSLKKNYIKFGMQASLHSFIPEMTILSEEGIDSTLNNATKTKATSISAFFENEIELTQKFKANVGMRYLIYNTNNLNKGYFEPHLSGRYLINKNLAIKSSVQRMVQVVNLISNSSLNMPTDLWVPATENFEPPEAWQVNLGTVITKNPGYDFSCDIYYKPMRNIIRYKSGVSLISGNGNNWEELIIKGEGLNYGTEILLEKNMGNFTGWLAYTLAWAKRKYKELNNGRYFPFKYDRRHDFSIFGNYSILNTETKKRDFTFTFTLSSGNAVTIPNELIAGINFPGLEGSYHILDNYETHEVFPYPNNYRMPWFHHLDIAYSTTKTVKKNKERTWKFSVYNVYNRLNPYFYYKPSSASSIYQISMLPIIPSVSFSYKW